MNASSLDTVAEIEPSAYGRWLVYSLGALLLVIALNIVVAWRLDPFGVLRDPKGRSLIASDDERKSKFLLSKAYVPENFDGLIIGSSASTSWDASELTGLRFYNESLPGANGSEERRVIEQLFPKGKFKVALVVVSPAITWTHEFEDGLDTVSRAEALGSIAALSLEYEVLRYGDHPRGSDKLPNGSHVRHPQPQHFEDVNQPYLYPEDPQAFSDFEAMVRGLEAHHVRVIFVTYPLIEPFRKVNEKVLSDYKAQVAADFPSVPMIDFNAPEYQWFREDWSNYSDRIHPSVQGSKKLVALVNQEMHTILDKR